MEILTEQAFQANNLVHDGSELVAKPFYWMLQNNRIRSTNFLIS
jgi:hypothetical protein